MSGSKLKEHDMKDMTESSSALRKSMSSLSVEETFPWLGEFRSRCKTSVASTARDPASLLKLMRFFNRNVSANIAECYKKSSRAAKLKELIKEALLLFMYSHRLQHSQDHQSRSLYLGQMSDLLGRYIDLELVVSKRDAKPAHVEISSRLVSCLSVYLENSTEHLLDTVMKIQLISESHQDILDAIITKIFKMVPPHPESETMYVRYLLVFRLWRKIHSLLPTKKQIYAKAMRSLPQHVPANLPPALLEEVLPPMSSSKETNYYLCHQFDLRKACNRFLEYCRPEEADENELNTVGTPVVTTGASQTTDTTERDPRLKRKDNSIYSGLYKTVPSTNDINNIKSNLTLSSNINSSTSSSSADSLLVVDNNPRVLTKPKVLSKSKNKKSIKSDEIVTIDLTDDTTTKIVRHRNSRSKIGWLELAKRKFDSHKRDKEAALKRDIEVAELHRQLEDSSFSTTEDILDDVESRIEQIHSESLEPNLARSCSVIRRIEPKNNQETVNSTSDHLNKTDFISPSEPKVQELPILSSRCINESHSVVCSVNSCSVPSPDVGGAFTEIDGLTLLASVSAQCTPKSPELKVKKEDQDKESVINQLVGIYPEEDEGNKQREILSYILDENIQKKLESNGNANVILNGETVMLLQKSPNSNLYIINKAAMEEDTKPVIKQEPDCYPGYCPAYPHLPNCACLSCAYRLQLPYYIPPTRIVEPQPEAMLAKLYDEGEIDRQQVAAPLDKKLPPKKRYLSQMSSAPTTSEEPVSKKACKGKKRKPPAAPKKPRAARGRSKKDELDPEWGKGNATPSQRAKRKRTTR